MYISHSKISRSSVKLGKDSFHDKDILLLVHIEEYVSIKISLQSSLHLSWKLRKENTVCNIPYLLNLCLPTVLVSIWGEGRWASENIQFSFKNVGNIFIDDYMLRQRLTIQVTIGLRYLVYVISTHHY